MTQIEAMGYSGTAQGPANGEATIYRRIASGGPETIQACAEIFGKYGYGQPTNRPQVAAQLADIVEKYGHPALADIANIHPDAAFILAMASPADMSGGQSKNDMGRRHYNCSGGCGGKCGSGNSMNDTGNVMPASILNGSSAESQSANNNGQILILSLLGLGAVTIFALIIIHATRPVPYYSTK